MEVLVPIFNEEKLISDKIQNLAELDYPAEKIKILFIDGGSTDGSIGLIENKIQNFPNMKLAHSPSAGKIQQLNFALQNVQSEYILITDVDALMDKDCLKQLMFNLSSDESSGVAGALVSPLNCCAEEEHYWLSQNRVRILESRFFGLATVVGPCYLFRRKIIDLFPGDVIADDIYISFAALTNGFKVKYNDAAKAYELRTAKHSNDMIRHKFRKANAYITEILRFSRFLAVLEPRQKLVFISRGLQIIGAVWIALNFALILLALLFLGEVSLVFMYVFVALISLAATHTTLSTVLPSNTKNAPIKSIFTGANVFLMLTSTLLLAALAYPFFKQDSTYKKIL